VFGYEHRIGVLKMTMRAVYVLIAFAAVLPGEFVRGQELPSETALPGTGPAPPGPLSPEPRRPPLPAARRPTAASAAPLRTPAARPSPLGPRLAALQRDPDCLPDFCP
jgi:hypothetical protein